MENKIPMNLQFFAEEGSPAPEQGAPEEAEATETEQQDQPTQTDSQKMFTQEELNKAVEKRMARYDRDHQSEVDDARNEATRLAKMNKDQKKDYQLDQANQRAQDAEEKLARYEMRDTVRQQLIDGGYIPTDDDISLIVTGDADTTKANGEAFLKTVERIKQSVREELLKGSTPKVSGTQVKAPTLDEFKNMSYTERVELKNKNPQVYDKLVEQSY